MTQTAHFANPILQQLRRCARNRTCCSCFLQSCYYNEWIALVFVCVEVTWMGNTRCKQQLHVDSEGKSPSPLTPPLTHTQTLWWLAAQQSQELPSNNRWEELKEWAEGCEEAEASERASGRAAPATKGVHAGDAKHVGNASQCVFRNIH